MGNKEEKKEINETKVTDEQVAKIKKDLKKSIDMSKIEELIEKNNIEFFHDGIKYRVNKPTYKEKQQAYQQQVEKITELLDNKGYLMEEVLKEKYKKKGIDVDKMSQQMTALETKKTNFQLKLGKLLKEKASDTDLKIYRDEIAQVQEEQLMLSIKKTNLLQYSVEHQALIYVYSFLTYLILQKEEKEKWIKAFNTYEEFAQSKEDLINQASAKASLVIGRV